MRRAAIVFAIAFGLGIIGVAALGLRHGSNLAYSLGVNPAAIAATLAPGDRACQAPIRPPAGSHFDRIGFIPATFGRPGPEVAVEVVDHGSGGRIAGGKLQGGYGDMTTEMHEQVVQIGRVEPREPLRICLINRGSHRVAIIGQAGIASPTTEATLNHQTLPSDLTINLRDEGQSLLALAPEIAERAARFRAGWVESPVYVGLMLAIVIGAPALLALGLARTHSESLRRER
jgi:hypothetical protein